MKLFSKKSTALLLIILFVATWACHQPEESGSMHPAEGYPFTKDIQEIEDILKHKAIDTIDFRPGEIIADIGAGNGYVEAMLSIFHDSLTFYIQDIDATVCNPQTFKEVKDYYQEVKGSMFQNEYKIVIGTDTATNLPDNTFDRILMLWTYQYLKSPETFMESVWKNLKDEGLLYVVNPTIEENEYTESLRLKYGWNVSPLEKQINDILNSGLDLVHINKNYDSDGYNEPYIMVFKKRNN
jgi:ubiquinone/menaquinone biosynthesis C-methylase UbiE